MVAAVKGYHPSYSPKVGGGGSSMSGGGGSSGGYSYSPSGASSLAMLPPSVARQRDEGEGVGTGWLVAGGVVGAAVLIAGGIYALRKYNEARAVGAQDRAVENSSEADRQRAIAENKRAAGEGDAARITANNALTKGVLDSLARSNDARTDAEKARDALATEINNQAAARLEEIARWGQAGVDRRDDCFGCGAIYCTNAAAINKEDKDRAPEWFVAKGKTGLTCEQLRRSSIGCSSVGVAMPCIGEGCSNGRQVCRNWMAATATRRALGISVT